jgi:hypothetical protein
MDDIMVLARRMRDLLCQPTEGDTSVAFLRRCREMSFNKWKFWQGMCHLLREQIRAVLTASLKVPWLMAFVGAILLIHFFVRAYTDDDFFSVATKESETEVNRGPPKCFTPIPKTELGGYARSDSLIHSLVFWRAVPPISL